ncbi:carbonate dehydratase [Aliidiomarina shirensis]|uniref:Carbonic anhydrase n=1 Tax=Aliidiomarina shirensis TaxID=1048642 RepID=A0A432WTV4_9GAMM|nr:carbonate dehydratase [Aliidiomarina shirensis]RUO37195.1 carbonate dehydratase [Aliidiomarina shirensis]
MPKIRDLLANNKSWAKSQLEQDPEYFNRLVNQQKPEYLWIGCSDSRVPANQIVGMAPGEVFVHRNVANQVIQTDFNCLAVIEFAVLNLQVKHVLVVGHYGCGGVQAAMETSRHGLVDHWLHPIKDIYRTNEPKLLNLPYDERFDRMCELNVIEQVHNLSKNHIIQEAWDRGQKLSIHGWCYSVRDGLVRDLGVTITGKEGLDPIYQYYSDEESDD